MGQSTWGCFTEVETENNMNLLIAVTLAILGAAAAKPGYYHGYGHGGYGGYGHGYYGKREAEATAAAEPGYYHHGYSHYGGYGHGYYGKREADAAAEPGYY